MEIEAQEFVTVLDNVEAESDPTRLDESQRSTRSLIPESQQLEIGRQRVCQVFRYLLALDQATNSAPRHLSKQLWKLPLADLPDHPSIQLAAFIDGNRVDATKAARGTVKEEDYLLRVRRPKLTDCPAPPEILVPWLERGWQEFNAEPRVYPSRNELDQKGRTTIISFDQDPKRGEALALWRSRRDSWIENERPARSAMGVFENFYELRGKIEREGEKVELVLGDGILSWRRTDGGVYHPVLLQRLQLEFDPSIPEFTISEADVSSELYSAMFQSMGDIDGKLISQVKHELEEGQFHPLGKEDTSGFLRSLVARLSANGQFVPGSAPAPDIEAPTIGRSPVLFMRARTLGFTVAIRAALEHFSKGGTIPSSLLRIVGIEQQAGTGPTETPLTWMDECQPPDVLLSKPANPEQIRIAHRLESHGSVLVQGPPGTGKSHSIANLIGHLLAQGKSVLVTSHTTKALRVLRNHVVEELRPLCVSLLDSDIESRKQLESSVGAIVAKLSHADVSSLERRGEYLEYERNALIQQFRLLGEEIVRHRASEYEPIAIGSQTFTPSEAARRVRDGEKSSTCIPAPVNKGVPVPLSLGELSELYRTNILVSAEHEKDLSGTLPDLGSLPSSAQFECLVRRKKVLAGADMTYRADLWTRLAQNSDLEQFEAISQKLLKVSERITAATPFELSPMLAGMHGPVQCRVWRSLVELIEEVWHCAAEHQNALLEHQPVIPPGLTIECATTVANEIVEHLDQGGKISFLARLSHHNWKIFLSQSRVATGEPSRIEHFRALLGAARLSEARRRLTSRWDAQMVPLGAPKADTLGPAPETICRQFAYTIERSLDWHDTEWLPIQEELRSLGLNADLLLHEQSPDFSPYGELQQIAKIAADSVQLVLAARRNQIEWAQIEAQQDEILAIIDKGEQSGTITDKLRSAVFHWNPDGYNEAFERLSKLWTERQHLERRRQLLARLEETAPGWAAAVRDRRSLHAGAECPANIGEAWLWRQLEQELARRAAVSVPELERKSAQVNESLRRVTANLIDAKAWAAEIRRTQNNLQQKQALIGWLDTVKKMGRGTGMRVPKLKAEANKLMTRCQGAVPVWIMPLARVVENFHPATTKFDVVIIDEASQADAMAMVALQLADRAIIVGDHEQVSPSAVGEESARIEHLIDEYLDGIPNAHLYDRRTSIYDLARQSFGGEVRLIEHFRCVPEIIQFSNHLSYDGQIRPLRDSSGVSTVPHVVAHRVHAIASKNKVNEREAEEITALVLAASEQPEYATKTFGVISMVGDEQAYHIEQKLRTKMSEEHFKLKHNILCGNPAHFQGDERDVVFLSVVDTGSDGVLALRAEERFKQRFNVAASRARDQMWVVHSLDPRAHLKPGDLRRKLIEYAEDPSGLLNRIAVVADKADSEFEKIVARRLIESGYSVTPQWRVGYYRIDLVVQGNGKKIAIECDGEKYHPIEKLPEDMARQAVLERLGWKFIRIRGSEFFRQAEATMKSVVDQITQFGIEPVGTDSEPPLKPSSELLERVKTRAKQIRAEWESTTSPTGAKADTEQRDSDIANGNNSEEFTDRGTAVNGKASAVDRSNLSSDPEEDQPDQGKEDECDDAESDTLQPRGNGLLTAALTSDQIRAAIHAALPSSGVIDQESLIRVSAAQLGFKRIRKNFRSRLNKTIGAEVRYGRLIRSENGDQLYRPQ